MTELRIVDEATLARLRTGHPGIDERVDESTELAIALHAITQASNFLTRLLLAEPESIEVLTHHDVRAPVPDNADDLTRWKQFEILRIATRDLLQVDELEAVGANLAAMAQDVLQSAIRIVGADDNLAIIGMGKLGARELNYASDIDIMFVGDAGEDTARAVIDIARRSFRIDAALRPEGRQGSLVRSVASYETYWERWANTWEFQALLKARPVAGPPGLQADWAASASDVLWDHSFGADELHELRAMKARSEQIVRQQGLNDREVKRGRGGIRDVEFSVQLLQLVHGGRDESLRVAGTLPALAQLVNGEYIDGDDGNILSASYSHLRTVEHRLQLVEDEQTHTIPTDKVERERLARVLGYRDQPNHSALDAFTEDLRTHQATVRQAHERLYFRPLLEAFAAGGLSAGSAMETQLSAFGFTDANRTRQAVQELTRGLARSSRLMQQMMPLLLNWLSNSPDPDEGLLGLRTLIAGFRTPTQVVTLFRDSPEAAQRLCLLLGTSRLLSQGVARYPELLGDLATSESLLGTEPVLERLRNLLGWRVETEARREALQRQTRSLQLRIAAADILTLLPPEGGGELRSQLADAVLTIALEEIAPQIPIALIAMGRFGGREMSYASDLDVIVVHDGNSQDEQLEAERVAQELLRFVGDPSPARQIFSMDYNLRPEGRKGVLARSIAGCQDYYAHWASTWERQALVRARSAAGDEKVGAAFMDVIHPFVWSGSVSAAELREIRQLKARMERERLPRGEDPRFHLKLGSGSLSDVEWTVQLQQLQHGVQATNTLTALQALVSSGIVAKGHGLALEEAWRFCDSVRNRWYLVNGGPSDSLPSSPESIATLARSLGMAPVELRERYRYVTRRARSAMERLFYGQGASPN